jgi:hypothetical protein
VNEGDDGYTALCDLIEGTLPESIHDVEQSPADVLAMVLWDHGYRAAATLDEWEYAVQIGSAIRGRFDGSRDRASVEAWWAEQRDLQSRGAHIVRRRPAGAWEVAP